MRETASEQRERKGERERVGEEGGGEDREREGEVSEESKKVK